MTDEKGAGDPKEGPVVTLDGPAGSGKSTTARAVARRLGFRHLDSGALYRALTWALLEEGIEPEAWDDLPLEALRDLDVEVRPTEEDLRIFYRGRPLGDEELRGPAVTRHVSDLARLPAVRERLLGLQREAGRRGRLVADGRDMGTVVFPDADVKVFLVADLEERARRRLGERGREAPTIDEVREEAERIRLRDRQDEEREHSPLRQPEDALALDTTQLSFDQQVEAVLQRVRGLTGP